ncbi:MAG: DinB family protein [Planctomycetota bacterium]
MRDALSKLFEHCNWANAELIRACAALDEAALDASPDPASPWTLRHTLTHLVESQDRYVSLLTLPPDERLDPDLAFDDLARVARESGAALLALACGQREPYADPLPTRDGYLVDPWLVLVQAVNHATDHRRQLAGMLRALGRTPPRVDGWAFGEHEGALAPA